MRVVASQGKFGTRMAEADKERILERVNATSQGISELMQKTTAPK